MNKIIAYEAKCKSCGAVHSSGNSPSFPAMPAACPKCGKDMAVVPVFEQDGKGRTYEVTIFCKETGVEVRTGAILTEDEMMKLQHEKLERRMITVLAEAFSSVLSTPKTQIQLLSKP